MNTYILNNIDLGSLGFTVRKQSGSSIALTGYFDSLQEQEKLSITGSGDGIVQIRWT